MADLEKKQKNYDYTAADRMRNRDARIKEAGLSNLKVVMHKDDAEAVREFARDLYEKRGININ